MKKTADSCLRVWRSAWPPPPPRSPSCRRRPATPEAKAKAAEAAAKTAWSGKVDAYKLCQSQDQVAAKYRASAAAAGKQLPPAPADAALRRPGPLRLRAAGRHQADRGRGRPFATRHGQLAAQHHAACGGGESHAEAVTPARCRA